MPCGAVPSYIPTPAKIQKQKGLPVVESQRWHRPPAREQCPDVSVLSSLLSLCIPTWTAAVQGPTPSSSTVSFCIRLRVRVFFFPLQN